MARKDGSGTANKKILSKALMRYQEGRLDEAGVLCRKILKRMPSEPNALHLMGVVQLMNGLRDEAAETLKRAAASDANNAEIHSNLASALNACGQQSDAEESYRRAIRLRPGYPQAHYNLGNLLRQQGKPDEAVAEYRRATELDPSYADAFNNIGAVMEAQQRAGDAERAFKAALGADPAHADAGRNLAHLYLTTGRPSDALRQYNEQLTHHPDDTASLNGMGTILADERRHAEASEAFEKALALDPDFTDALTNLGNSLCMRHMPEQACEHLAQAVELDPGCVDTITNFGHALRQCGRLDEAIDTYEMGLSDDPDSLEANFGAAVTELSRGRFADGWRYYMARDSMRARSAEFDRAPLPQDLAGRRVLVVGDQGLGDELFFLRFMPQLRKRLAWTAYLPDRRLIPMLERAAIAQCIVGSEGGKEADAGSFDLRLSVGDLPFLLGMTERASIPDAFPIPVLADRREQIDEHLRSLGPPPYIGVTWRAGTANRKRLLFKDAPIEKFAEALRDAPGTILALQRIPESGEIHALADHTGREVHDLTKLNDDLEGMLALMAVIDDYVCVSNTNVHLRAAAGRTSRVLVPNPPEFRSMAEGDESPWSPGTRLYRQRIDGGWDEAFERLRQDMLGDAS